MISTIHVVPHIMEEAAGPSYSVPRLCQSLNELGDEVQLHCLQDAPPQWDFPIHAHRQWAFPAQLGVSPAMYRGLCHAVREADIMHNHSLWMMPNIFPAWVTRNRGCRLVASPRGTLDPWAWARSRWKKMLVWPLQQETLLRAACLHATAESEYRHIRSRNLSAPVAIIPNGIDIPERPLRTESHDYKELLFLARIHPKKGIDLLLQVWSRIEPFHPDWRLRIVGPDNVGYLQEMKQLAEVMGLERVTFEGAVYGRDKTRVYQSASLYVLPTHTENFGITVAEALANGVPVIVTKGAPWEGLKDKGCGWWIERDERVLFETLQEAMSLSTEELREMGDRGRNWMTRDFSWKEIGRKMHVTYEWLLGGGLAPDWVRLV